MSEADKQAAGSLACANENGFENIPGSGDANDQLHNYTDTEKVMGDLVEKCKTCEVLSAGGDIKQEVDHLICDETRDETVKVEPCVQIEIKHEENSGEIVEGQFMDRVVYAVVERCVEPQNDRSCDEMAIEDDLSEKTDEPGEPFCVKGTCETSEVNMCKDTTKADWVSGVEGITEEHLACEATANGTEILEEINETCGENKAVDETVKENESFKETVLEGLIFEETAAELEAVTDMETAGEETVAEDETCEEMIAENQTCEKAAAQNVICEEIGAEKETGEETVAENDIDEETVAGNESCEETGAEKEIGEETVIEKQASVKTVMQKKDIACDGNLKVQLEEGKKTDEQGLPSDDGLSTTSDSDVGEVQRPNVEEQVLVAGLLEMESAHIRNRHQLEILQRTIAQGKDDLATHKRLTQRAIQQMVNHLQAGILNKCKVISSTCTAKIDHKIHQIEALQNVFNVSLVETMMTLEKLQESKSHSAEEQLEVLGQIENPQIPQIDLELVFGESLYYLECSQLKQQIDKLDSTWLLPQQCPNFIKFEEPRVYEGLILKVIVQGKWGTNQVGFYVMPASTDLPLKVMFLNQLIRRLLLQDPTFQSFSGLGVVPEQGEFIFAQWSVTNCWYRAKVMQINGEDIQCFLMDCGVLATCSTSNARPFREDLCNMESSLIACTFEDLLYNDNTLEARWHFNFLISSNIDGLTLQCTFDRQVELQGSAYWCVHLTCGQQDVTIDITQEVQQKLSTSNKSRIKCRDIRQELGVHQTPVTEVPVPTKKSKNKKQADVAKRSQPEVIPPKSTCEMGQPSEPNSNMGQPSEPSSEMGQPSEPSSEMGQTSETSRRSRVTDVNKSAVPVESQQKVDDRSLEENLAKIPVDEGLNQELKTSDPEAFMPADDIAKAVEDTMEPVEIAKGPDGISEQIAVKVGKDNPRESDPEIEDGLHKESGQKHEGKENVPAIDENGQTDSVRCGEEDSQAKNSQVLPASMEAVQNVREVTDQHEANGSHKDSATCQEQKPSSVWQHDNTGYLPKGEGSHSWTSRRRDHNPEERFCTKCRTSGHNMKECQYLPIYRQNERHRDFNRTRTCHNCGQPGHLKANCPKQNQRH